VGRVRRMEVGGMHCWESLEILFAMCGGGREWGRLHNLLRVFSGVTYSGPEGKRGPAEPFKLTGRETLPLAP